MKSLFKSIVRSIQFNVLRLFHELLSLKWSNLVILLAYSFQHFFPGISRIISRSGLVCIDMSFNIEQQQSKLHDLVGQLTGPKCEIIHCYMCFEPRGNVLHFGQKSSQRSPFTVTLRCVASLQKYGPMMTPVNKPHQTVTFSECIGNFCNASG